MICVTCEVGMCAYLVNVGMARIVCNLIGVVKSPIACATIRD